MTVDLSTFKPFCLLIYSLYGVCCLCAALNFRRGRRTLVINTNLHRDLAFILTILMASILLAGFAITGSRLLVAATAAGTIIFAAWHAAWKAPPRLLAAASAVILVLSLAWWRMAPNPPAPLPLATFAIILGGLTIGFSDSRNHRCHTPAVPLAAFLIAGLLLLVDLGAYPSDEAILSLLAHHWGAYIGSALHLGAGLVPFRDVPLQYGLGPTLLITAGCGATDCWTAMEFIVVVLNLANGLLILRMVLTTAEPRSRIWHCAATIVVFAAVFLWPGAPANGSSVLATPSVGGLRFLPTTLVACLLFFGRPAAAAAALVPAVLWSPESAAISITIFGLCETARIGPARSALRSIGLLAGSYGSLLVVHRCIYGDWVDPAAFAEYVLHVPGPMPVNPFSDAMLLAAVLGLGGWLLLRVSPDPVTARRDRTATFLLFAAASYWLGRSHPNNICNLAPFLVLVAFRAVDRAAPSSMADVTRFGLSTSVAALAMSPWHSIPYDPRATVDIQAVVADFTSLEPDIERIRGQIANPNGLGIADFGPSYTRHPSEELVWTPMDPSSLWSFVPSERRQLYIRRAAARLRRSGWAIFDEDQLFLFDDLRAGYTVAEQHSFLGAPSSLDGTQRHYVAACFNPRPDVAASIVGPACPAPLKLAAP